jgi:hypothetical protein
MVESIDEMLVWSALEGHGLKAKVESSSKILVRL